MTERFLTVWVVFFNPADFPGKYVVRRQYAGGGGGNVEIDPVAFVFDTLAEAHEVLPPGLYNMGRQEGDVPSIVEVWV